MSVLCVYTRSFEYFGYFSSFHNDSKYRNDEVETRLHKSLIQVDESSHRCRITNDT